MGGEWVKKESNEDEEVEQAKKKNEMQKKAFGKETSIKKIFYGRSDCEPSFLSSYMMFA